MIISTVLILFGIGCILVRVEETQKHCKRISDLLEKKEG